MYDPYTEFTKYVLSNGLEVHQMSWDRPWIRMEIVVHSGAREDRVSQPGVAHFVEHCVSKNIPDRTYDSVKEFFEGVGGQADFGGTSYLATRYKFAVPADMSTFLEAISIFGSMLLGAHLDKDIERERMVINREFNQKYRFLEQLEWDMAIRRSIFKGHRLETYNRPLGRPEGFLSVTAADLQDFYDQHYTPANMSLVILGGLSIDEVITQLEESPFGEQKEGRRNTIPAVFNQFVIPAEQSRAVKMSDHVKFKVDQTEYKATWAFPLDFPRQARRVFNLVLGQILFDEIREKRGLAYNLGISYGDYQDVCEYQIGGRINPDATSYINELVRMCISMVPSRLDLFDRKRNSAIKQCLMMDHSGAGLCGECASELANDQRIIPIQEVWDNLHKVTFEQMWEAVNLLSADRQYTFIAQP